ncbi:uncharacterized protein LOC111643791 [Copidosoma floridanum]|nr:uncharacterized protein LOC111643791 [Copidosoma floridanum]
MSMKKIDRQQKIKQSHHFICDCVACKENWSTDLMSNVLSDNYNKLKLLSEFEKIDGIEEVHAVLSAKNDDKFANKSVTINIIKMIQIVYETLTGYKACLHSFLLRPWITKHYEKVLGVKIFDIPSDC